MTRINNIFRTAPLLLIALFYCNQLTASVLSSFPASRPHVGVYLNSDSGRFWSIDNIDGMPYDPISLHKYLYANINPVNEIDPSGKFTLVETTESLGIATAFGVTLYLATPQGHSLVLQVGYMINAMVLIPIIDRVSDILTVYNNKHTEAVVDGLLVHAVTHADKLEGYSSGGGPQDPRDGWRKEIKAALERALRLVHKRLKGQKAEDYINQIKEIADKSGVTLD